MLLYSMFGSHKRGYFRQMPLLFFIGFSRKAWRTRYTPWRQLLLSWKRNLMLLTLNSWKSQILIPPVTLSNQSAVELRIWGPYRHREACSICVDRGNWWPRVDVAEIAASTPLFGQQSQHPSKHFSLPSGWSLCWNSGKIPKSIEFSEMHLLHRPTVPRLYASSLCADMPN